VLVNRFTDKSTPTAGVINPREDVLIAVTCILGEPVVALSFGADGTKESYYYSIASSAEMEWRIDDGPIYDDTSPLGWTSGGPGGWSLSGAAATQFIELANPGIRLRIRATGGQYS